jgi:hypothetical protein
VRGNGERKTMAVDDCHPLGTLAPLCLTDSAPPFFAAAKLPSMKASFQSMRPRWSRSSSSVRLTFAIVPSLAHRRKRRWQVAFDGYRSGKSPHGAPVRNIQRMPFKTSRGSRYGRPRRSFRSRGFGRSGASTSHCLSVRSIRDHMPNPRWVCLLENCK